MNSKITIEVDFENNNEPTLQIIYRPSDDIRDKLIRAFIEKLQGTSSWCSIFCVGSVEESSVNYASQKWTIKPIPPKSMKGHGESMIEQHNMLFEQGNVDLGHQ